VITENKLAVGGFSKNLLKIIRAVKSGPICCSDLNHMSYV
jgi:hypothetical protein